MTDETLTFVVPLPPNRANARGNWRKHHAEKKAYWETLDMLHLLHGAVHPNATRGMRVPPSPVRAWPAASIRVTFYVVREMDDDNAPNRAKWLLDWLVTRGYVVDDNRKALAWDGFPRQVKCKRTEVRVEVTLTKRVTEAAA